MPVSGFFWSKVPASLDNFASEASFSKRGTCSVPSAGLVNFASFSERGTRSMPSARSADRGSAPGGGRGAKPPDFFSKNKAPRTSESLSEKQI